MHPSLKRLFCTTAVFVLLASPALGGPLLVEPGSSVMSGSEPFLAFAAVKARVEYAVFAPGDFGTYAPLGSPATFDPSGGSEYVYAYEIFNDQPGGSTGIALLSINLLPGVVGVDPDIPAFLPIALGVEPSATEFIPVGDPIPANIKWTFTAPGVDLTEHSAILLFTSPFEPELRNATMTGVVAISAGGFLPSPSLTVAPEPSTLVLSAMAAIGFLAAGYLRRRKV